MPTPEVPDPDLPHADVPFFEVLTTARWLANVLPAAAVREDFRTFLVEPIRRAGATLHRHTGVRLSEGT